MADQRLLSMVERITRLEEERAALLADVRDIYAEAKSAGYDVPALRQVVKQRMETATQREKREAREMARELMIAALGDFGGTALGAAAVERVA